MGNISQKVSLYPLWYRLLHYSWDSYTEYMYRPFCRKCGGRVDISRVKRECGNLCLDCFKTTNRERGKERYHLRPETRKLNNKNSFYKHNGIEGRYTIDEWKTKLVEYDYRCAYCGDELLDSISTDHTIPVSRGGSNNIDNIVPACRKCNSRKNNKTLEEYIKYLLRFNGG